MTSSMTATAPRPCDPASLKNRPSAQCNPHDLQIIRRHAGGQRQRLLVLAAARPEWSGIRSGCCLPASARYPPWSRLALPVCAACGPALLPDGARPRRVRPVYAGESAIRAVSTFADVHPGIEGREMQHRAPQHPGGNQQHHRQRDLRDHEAAVQAARASRNRLRPPARSACSSSRARNAQRRRQSEKKPLTRDTPSAKSSTCQSSRTSSARGKLPGQNCDKRPDAPPPPAARPARLRERQHRAFRQALPRQPAAARAQRHPHRQFPLARNRARQQQAGDVHARDQQHQADRAQ